MVALNQNVYLTNKNSIQYLKIFQAYNRERMSFNDFHFFKFYISNRNMAKFIKAN